MFAALGGVLSAARLASASQQAGTGDVNLNAIAAAVIGGTSLFGGRGSAYSALLGIIVIQSIASGLTLLDLSSSLRYMITGAVLAIAVIVDSLAAPVARLPRPAPEPSRSKRMSMSGTDRARSRRSPAPPPASASNAPRPCCGGRAVVLVDRAEDRLKALCAELGPDAIPLVVDLTDPGERRDA